MRTEQMCKQGRSATHVSQYEHVLHRPKCFEKLDYFHERISHHPPLIIAVPSSKFTELHTVAVCSRTVDVGER